MNRTILVLAGEASGDKHGAKLIREIRRLEPGVRFVGIGGAAMQAQGMDVVVDNRSLSVMGFLEVVNKMGRVWDAFKEIRTRLVATPPDLVILIDFPEFNLLVARMAHKRRIPVVYYISPQVWAWRRGRVRQIARYVRKMLVIFPFEADFYRRRGVNVEFVGHPVLDDAFEYKSRQERLQQLGLNSEKRYVGLLPGSRRSEIRYMLDRMLRAANLLARRFPDLEFILPLAPTLDRSDVSGYLMESRVRVHVIQDAFPLAAQCLEAALVTSGSATLETALWGVPQCVVYRMSPVSYWLGRLVVRVPFIGMVNLIAGRRVAVELLQGDATPIRMADEISSLLRESHRRAAMRSAFEEVRSRLGGRGASERAARSVLKVLRAEVGA